jgi:hypothetical protein
MDDHPIRDKSLLVPLLISAISLLGIFSVLALTWRAGQNPESFTTPTVAPFQYLLLATETAFLPPPEAPTEILPTPTEVLAEEATTPMETTEPIGIATDEFFTPTITITADPIFTKSVPMTAGTYDDADSKIIRKGTWNNQDNVDAHQKTLLVSNTVGNYVAFSFTGLQMILGYQSSDNAGNVTMNIDELEVTITQLVGNAWFSQELGPGTHYVILTHESGTTVNLDYIEILN